MDKKLNRVFVYISFLLLAALVLPYSVSAAALEVYYLENGMQVVLIEDHTAPVIASSIIVRAGLRDEMPSMIGASHLLEHLLFNGTVHRTQEDIYEEMDLLGGYNNAHTGDNFANFVILMDKDNFAAGLDIQTDMLFNSVIPNKKFEKEKGIVIEEIGQSYDRSSYMADIHFNRRFFKGLPYENQVLGSRKSIEAMKRPDMMRYYKSHYIPNNMTALIIGDFDPAEIKAVIDKYLGAPPPGELPERPLMQLEYTIESPGIAPVDIHHENTPNMYLRVGVPAPGRIGSDYYTCELLTRLLENELDESLKSGENPPVQDFSLEYFTDQDFGALILRARLNSQADIERAVELFHRGFADLKLKRITSSAIENIITSMRVQDLLDSERPHFYAMMKAGMLAFHDYDFVRYYNQNLAKVSPQQINGLAGYFYEYAPIIPTAVVPYEAAVEDTADISEARLHRTLPNGLELIIERGTSGVFAAHFLFKHRCLAEPDGKAGITNFLHNMLLKGTKNLSEKQLNDKLLSMGINITPADIPWIPFDDYRTEPTFSYVRMETSDEYWKEAMGLTAEVIRQPAFRAQDVEAVRGMLMGAMMRDKNSASAAAEKQFKDKLLAGSPQAMSVNGGARSLSSINREDLLDFHSRYFTPNNLILTIIGGEEPVIIANEIDKLFGGMKSSDIVVKPSYPPQPQTGMTVDTLNLKQSYIYLGRLIPALSEKDKAALTAANAILSDRIQFQLREREGLAYSLGSFVRFEDGYGYFAVYMGTGSENIERAVTGIKEEIESLTKSPFTYKEITKAVNSYLNRLNMRRLTSINRAYYLGLYASEGKDLDYNDEFSELLKDVTIEDAVRCAQEYLKTDDLTEVIVY